MNCPVNVSSTVFGADGSCGKGKCCVGFVYDDFTALKGGSAAGRFEPPRVTSATVVDQQVTDELCRCQGLQPTWLAVEPNERTAVAFAAHVQLRLGFGMGEPHF